MKIYNDLDDDDKDKEIFAHFGLAVFAAQTLEQQAIIMIAICKQAKGRIATPEDVRKLWKDYDLGSRSLGTLIKEVKEHYNLSDEDLIEVKDVLRLRNYIAHDYFRFNTELFYSESGQKRMIKDFIEFRERVNSLDTKLVQYQKKYVDEIGLTAELITIIMQQTKVEWEKMVIADDHKTI